MLRCSLQISLGLESFCRLTFSDMHTVLYKRMIYQYCWELLGEKSHLDYSKGLIMLILTWIPLWFWWNFFGFFSSSSAESFVFLLLQSSGQPSCSSPQPQELHCFGFPISLSSPISKDVNKYHIIKSKFKIFSSICILQKKEMGGHTQLWGGSGWWSGLISGTNPKQSSWNSWKWWSRQEFWRPPLMEGILSWGKEVGSMAEDRGGGGLSSQQYWDDGEREGGWRRPNSWNKGTKVSSPQNGPPGVPAVDGVVGGGRS